MIAIKNERQLEAMLFSGVVRSCGCQIRVAAREAKTYIDGTCLEIMLS